MRSVKVLLVIIAIASQINAQSIGRWKIYSDMKVTVRSVSAQGKLWVASSGGLYSFSIADSNINIYTKADGLNSQALTSLSIDGNNKVWVGSTEGYINILDTGTNQISSVIDIFKSDYPQKQINDLFIKGDTVFASIDFGLTLLSVTNFSIYDSFLKLGSFPAQSKVISSYKSSLIYACTAYGVAVQKPDAQNLSAPESWNNYYVPTDINAASVTKITGFNGDMLLSTSNGIFKYSNNSWGAFILQGDSIADMAVSGNILYLISSSKLYQYSGGQLTTLYQNSSTNFQSLMVSGQGIFISTGSGLIQFNNNKARLIRPNGPNTNSFINLSVDLFGRLWVATGKDVGGVGFFMFDGKLWKTYDKATYPQLPSDAYYNVFAAPDSAVYLSNWGGGVTILKNNVISVFNNKNSSLSDYNKDTSKDTSFVPISDIKVDSKGNVWILNDEPATKQPLTVYTKQKKWYSYSFNSPNYIGSDPTGALVIDPYDTKWFSIINGDRGLYYFNEKGTFDITGDDIVGSIGTSNLSSDLITCLAVDKKGYIWVGTNLGLNIINNPTNPTATSAITSVYALVNQPVTCITVDPLDHKWVGTTSGVFVLSSDGINLLSQYTSSNSPLPNNSVTSITFDPLNGIAYIGTNYGLAALTTSSIQPKDSFSGLFIYPNPMKLTGTGTTQVTIDGLIKDSHIKIFTISGKVIRDFDSPGGRVAFWDGRDMNGNLVASGIYIIAAYDLEANNVTTSKIAVIRK